MDTAAADEERPLLLHNPQPSPPATPQVQVAGCLEYTTDGSTDINKQPALRHSTGQWRACYPILAVEFCESMAFFSIAKNLVTYLTTVLHESKVSAAKNMSAWVGACFLSPLVGAFMADTYMGRYWTVVVSLLVYIVGMLVIIVSAASTKHQGSSIPGEVVYLGFYLAALGSGGVKPCTSSFGADQFDVNDPVELAKKASFFNWYYFLISFSNMLSSTVIVWVQDNVGWAVSYAIPVASMLLCLAVFVARSRVFRFRKMGGVSPLLSISQVVVAAATNWKLQLPDDASLLYELHGSSDTHLLKHTKQFRFFDRAALVAVEPSSTRRPCTVTQVEELKMLLRMGPTWWSSIVFFAVTAQMSSTLVEQGMLMDNQIGWFTIPPASLSIFGVLGVLALVPVYETVLVPLARRLSGKRRGLSPPQRLGIGLALSALTMAYAALVETRRLAAAGMAARMSILWQAPVHMLHGAAEVFAGIGMTEFFYDQAPDTMKSLCAALGHLAIASGSYFNSLLLGVVAAATTRGGAPGWIPDNLNEGHLDYFFWMMAALSLFNLALFVHRSMRSAGRTATA